MVGKKNRSKGEQDVDEDGKDQQALCSTVEGSANGRSPGANEHARRVSTDNNNNARNEHNTGQERGGVEESPDALAFCQTRSYIQMYAFALRTSSRLTSRTTVSLM